MCRVEKGKQVGSMVDIIIIVASLIMYGIVGKVLHEQYSEIGEDATSREVYNGIVVLFYMMVAFNLYLSFEIVYDYVLSYVS